MTKTYWVSYVWAGPTGSGFGATDFTIDGPLTVAVITRIKDKLKDSNKYSELAILAITPLED
jgi:hypothetical protein